MLGFKNPKLDQETISALVYIQRNGQIPVRDLCNNYLIYI